MRISKLCYLGFCSIALAIGLLSCTEEPSIITVTSVTLDSTSITLIEGDSQTLTATVSPSNVENQKVLWSSSNSSVASVKDGIVTAIKVGAATITAKSDDGGKTATCTVTVEAKNTPVTGVTLDKTSYEMTEGDEVTLTATISPENATNKNVSWSSSNTSIATVDNGKVTALGEGNTTIMVKTEDGNWGATCDISVIKAITIPVVAIELNYTSLKIYKGDQVQLLATVKPRDATDKNVVWSSDTPSVVTVNADGLVTAILEGNARISATAGGIVSTCDIIVEIPSAKEGDYIDEYGINHGQGVTIGQAVWAPVNCGYHEEDYQYGKLYQWGRKYGQGYGGSLYDVYGKQSGKYEDATIPTIEEGGVSVTTGNSKSKANVFFYYQDAYNADWVYPQDNKLWNSGSEDNPVKTEYDPCPDGWRVPTSTELSELCKNTSSWESNDGMGGYWVCGTSTYGENVPQIFLSAAGCIDNWNGKAYYRGYECHYYSSTANSGNPSPSYKGFAYRAYSVGSKYTPMITNTHRATACSVRCVLE